MTRLHEDKIKIQNSMIHSGNIVEAARLIGKEKTYIYEQLAKDKRSMRRIVAGGDLHLEDGVPNPYKDIFVRFVQIEKPDEVVLAGDIGNFGCINHHTKTELKKVEGKRLLKAFELINDFIAELRPYTKKIVYIEGNHEAWIEKLINEQPTLEGFMELKRNIKNVDDFVMNYEMGNKNTYVVNEHLGIVHGHFHNSNVAASYLKERPNMCTLSFHIHKFQEFTTTLFDPESNMGKPRASWTTGCLCTTEIGDYFRGRIANWQPGFAMLHVLPNGYFFHTPLRIINECVMYNDQLYY